MKIICLANSWKHEERCIAGINPDTGKWIRPVCDRFPKDGKVPKDIRLIEGEEPALLDLLEIPLSSWGMDFGFESENLNIAPGKWQKLGKVNPTDLLKYCDNSLFILHNNKRYVTVPYLQSLPFSKRKTLQLLYVPKLDIFGEPNSTGGMKWKANLTAKNGEIITNIKITDPDFIQKLDQGYYPENPCLITVSLSMPYVPYNDWDKGEPCWKLIAGIIEFSNYDLILVEMERIGWTIAQGKDYLIKTYGKSSRSQLTEEELQKFLLYLQSL
jgi:hypothetical protein